MVKPRFVNVYVLPDAETGELKAQCAPRHWGSRLDADVAAVGFANATCCEPHAGRHLRAAGVAYKLRVTLKPGAAGVRDPSRFFVDDGVMPGWF